MSPEIQEELAGIRAAHGLEFATAMWAELELGRWLRDGGLREAELEGALARASDLIGEAVSRAAAGALLTFAQLGATVVGIATTDAAQLDAFAREWGSRGARLWGCNPALSRDALETVTAHKAGGAHVVRSLH